MKKVTALLVWLIFVCSTAYCQRTLSLISTGMDNPFDEVVLSNRAYFTERYSRKLQVYDGTSLSNINYPFIGSVQLEYRTSNSDYYSQRNQLVSAFGKVFIGLQHPLTSQGYLYKVDGLAISPVPLTGSLVSNLVLYRGKIHMLLQTTAGIRLYSYDGTSLSEIPFVIGGSLTYALILGGDYLFIQGRARFDLPVYCIRYNGTSFLRITDYPTSSPIRKILASPSSIACYFILDDTSISYFDGGTTRVVISTSTGETLVVSGAVLWNKALYFEVQRPSSYKFYKTRDYRIAEIPITFGTLQMGEPAVYMDNLYLTVWIASKVFVCRFDGSSFFNVYEYPGAPAYPVFSVRQGKLVIRPSPSWTPTQAVEHNGASPILIHSPDDAYTFERSYGSTTCYHTWSIRSSETSDYYFAIERPDPFCSTAATVTSDVAVTYYPNPFQSTLNLVIPKSSGSVNISLSDLNGKKIYSKNFTTEGSYHIDMINQKKGLYILTIEDRSGIRKELVEMR